MRSDDVETSLINFAKISDLKITQLPNKVCMSDTFNILKHSQIRKYKFILILGEREKHSRKIDKSMRNF